MTMSRRDLLLSTAGLVTAACAKSGAISWPRKTVYEGVEFLELFPNEADESSPLVFAVHGRGDKPERWVETWSRFPARAQIAMPRAFTKWGDGFTWFELRDRMTDEELGTEVGAAETRLWKGVARLAGSRRFVVTGFSQGGILAFAMAARHPAPIVKAFPVAGSCPGPLLPRNKAKAAPVLAFHGTLDDVIRFQYAREAVEAFRAEGNAADLVEYPGVGHGMTDEMRTRLWSEIKRSIV
jgi:phospholipase/carboxylesterase